MAHVRRVLTAFRDAGVAPWACLLHGTAPGWFTDDERGWLDDRAVLRWARHVDRIAEEIGDLVAGWVPIHEPRATARAGHGDGTFPPGRHDEDDYHEARAALPEAFLTATEALFAVGRLVAGECVLVHAAASGVGTAALQLAPRRSRMP